MITGVDQNSVLEVAFGILFRGGWVLAPIFVLGWFGWFLMLERYGYYFMLRGRSFSAFWKTLEKKGEDAAFAKMGRRRYGYFYALIKDVRKHRAEGPVAVRNAMEATRHRISLNLAKSLKTISTCAALAPMMGLLGTVSGMVHTFETIQLFGFGNPVLLADGISEALLTTQAGLLVAFPLMLAYNYLSGKVAEVEDDAWSEALKFESYVFDPEKFECHSELSEHPQCHSEARSQCHPEERSDEGSSEVTK
ncbi:MAG: MotA/TolQ/ExbB proton channel family protein [Fibrobacter sp.]|nr:MotA/TolQ/ExbB proton channel family protein [Fibrobacter sp.]